MAKLENYRAYIKDLLNWLGQAGQAKPSNGKEVNTQVIFDEQRDHYQLLDLGWENNRRIFNCVVHLDVIDGKIWIQRNQTDVDLAAQLTASGVPKEDIVLGLHAPYKRPYTGFAVG